MPDNGSLPLAGIRVVVTRAERQAADLTAALAAAGATVEPLPLLEVVPPTDPDPLARAAAEIRHFDWIVFTSTNAVHALPSLAALATGRPRAAAVGAATAAALRGLGVEPALVAPPGDEQAAGLLKTLLPHLDCGHRVLLPQAADARPALRDGLLKAGILAVAVVAYEKRLPREAPARAAHLFDHAPLGWVTFTSPTTVRHFLALFGPAWPRRRPELKAAAIGPVTAAELQHHQVTPAAVAASPSAAHLVAALATAITSGRSAP